MADCGWVQETRFGIWFQSTEIWRSYVLAPGLDALNKLLGSRARAFGRVLDAGCGDGGAFRQLEERFQPDALVGVDIDPSAIERASQEAKHCRISVEVRVGDVTKLDLEDASFDMVFCHQTLHHVTDQVTALHEFYRVLQPSGVLLLTESCRSFIRLPRVRALFRHPMEVQRSAVEYSRLLREAGYDVETGRTSTASPWWSRTDFGVRERLGLREPPNREPTQVHIAALRPDGPAP